MERFAAFPRTNRNDNTIHKLVERKQAQTAHWGGTYRISHIYVQYKKQQARVLAWDIHRHWELWVQSCCPAEEARLRKKGRTFEDPEEFRHADQLSPPPSPSGPSSSSDPQEEQASSTPNNKNQLVIEEQALEATTQQQQPSLGVRLLVSKEEHGEDAGAATTRTSIPFSSGERKEEAPPPSSRPPSTLLPDRQDHRGDGGAELKWLLAPNESLLGGGAREGEPCHHHQEENEEEEEDEEDEDEEFRPRTAMSARAVVRQRRQWALRRARRQEGPNEANQLELGGGSPAGTAAIGEAWVETVVKVAVSGRGRAEEVTKGGGEVKIGGRSDSENDAGGGGGAREGEVGIVELLVSPFHAFCYSSACHECRRRGLLCKE